MRETLRAVEEANAQALGVIGGWLRDGREDCSLYNI